MNEADELRKKAAMWIRFSEMINNPIDIARFEAFALEARQAASELDILLAP